MYIISRKRRRKRRRRRRGEKEEEEEVRCNPRARVWREGFPYLLLPLHFHLLLLSCHSHLCSE